MQPWQDENVVIIWFFMGLMLVLILTIVLVVIFKKIHKKHLLNKVHLADLAKEHQQQLESSNIEIQDLERKRIGSDLHDSVINSLNVLFLQSQLGIKEDLLVDNIQETILLTRRISHGLNPPLLEYESIDNLIRDLLQEWSVFYTLDIHMDKQQQFELEIDEKMHCLRIVQELISNIHKHAQATVITVHLRLSSRFLVLTLKDNGKGFDDGPIKKGLGLQNIQQRVSILNGLFKFKNLKTQGALFVFVLKSKNQ